MLVNKHIRKSILLSLVLIFLGQNIYSQKIGMMSRRYLRDLRRDAVIEYR